MQTRRSKADQSEKTIGHLIDVGRELFTRHGYAQTSTEEIAQRAGVTRGALYHHFGSKEGLFVAVLRHVQQEVGQQVDAAAAQNTDLWEQLRAGCHAFLAASTHPQVRRIMLIDAPAVVGWETWRRQDAENAMASLRISLSELIERGYIVPQPVEALTHLLSGAMNEAALWVVQSGNPVQALDEATTVLDYLLGSLRSGDEKTSQSV